MKKLIFIFCALALIACNDDDPEITQIQDESELENSKIFISDLSVGVGTYVEMNDVHQIRKGDTITDISVNLITNAPKLKYEIVEESLRGAVVINPDTGVLIVNDIAHFVPDTYYDKKIIIHVKVSAGEISTTHVVTINIYNYCVASIERTRSKMIELTNSGEYFWDYDLISDLSEYTFILSEDMQLCGLMYHGYYSDQGSLSFELSDESGNQIFSQTIAGVDDGWGGLEFFTPNFYFALRAGKKYTIKMISPNSTYLSYIRTHDNSTMQFPLSLGFMQIVDAGNSLNVKSGFPAIILGFAPQ